MRLEQLLINQDVTLISALEKLDAAGKRCLFAVDDKGQLKGSLTDGDVRRYIVAKATSKGKVKDAMKVDPVYVSSDKVGIARDLMRKYNISAIPVVDGQHVVTEVILEGGNNYKRAVRTLETPLPVVMMAGGVGSRLMPITSVIPKPLVPVNGKPIAEHIIDRFCEAGCRDFYFVLNYKKGMIKAYFEDLERDYDVTYLEEKQYLGTGGGLKLTEGCINTPFFLTNCDVLIDADLYDLVAVHMKSHNVITVVCSLKNYAIPYGTIEISEGGQIIGMREKPSIPSLVNTGCYLVDPRVLDFIGIDESIGFPDVILRCQKAGLNVGVYPISEGSWLDMGQPDELERMSKMLDNN